MVQQVVLLLLQFPPSSAQELLTLKAVALQDKFAALLFIAFQHLNLLLNPAQLILTVTVVIVIAQHTNAEQEQKSQNKLWLSTLLSGTFVKTTGEWEPNYVEVLNQRISRVNVVAPVVEKFIKEDRSYAAISLDDGSGKIQVKSWKDDVVLLGSLNVGDLLLVVGKVKDFNNNLFLVPEVVRKLDNPLWAKLRKLELIKLHGEAKVNYLEEQSLEEAPSVKTEDEFVAIVEEKVMNAGEKNSDAPANKRQRLLNSIENLDTNNGADQEIVITSSGVEREEAQKIIQNLLKEGEVFELHPGKLRTII